MKIRKTISVALFFIVFISMKTYAQQTISADSAKHFVNKLVFLKGTVVDTYITKGDKPNIILNIDKKYPNQTMSVVIFNSNIEQFSYNPAAFLKDKKVKIKGKITMYKGKPQIILKKESDIEIQEISSKE